VLVSMLAGMTHHRNTNHSISRHIGRVASLLVLPALAATGSLLLTTTAGAEQTADLRCGTVVTGNVRLTADLRDCPSSGLIVGAPGITIDLAGYVIDGTGSGAGIDNESGHDNVRIIRGTVREFTFGVNLFEADGARLDRVVASDNANGFKIAQSAGVQLDRLVAHGNAAFGIEITFSSEISVRRSTAYDNVIGGIVDRFSVDSRYLGNTSIGNGGSGLTIDSVERAVAKRNHLAANHIAGLELVGVSDAQIVRNTASGNFGNGISMDRGGNTLTANRAIDNTDVGIAATADTIDGGHNRARGNAGGNCRGVACR
jgi:large repetitive protein